MKTKTEIHLVAKINCAVNFAHLKYDIALSSSTYILFTA